MTRARATRATKTLRRTIVASGSTSDDFDLDGFAGGLIISLSDAWTTAYLGAKVLDRDETEHVLADRSNSFGTDVAIAAITAGRAYPIPPYWFGAGPIALFSQDGSGNAELQGADHEFELRLKS